MCAAAYWGVQIGQKKWCSLAHAVQDLYSSVSGNGKWGRAERGIGGSGFDRTRESSESENSKFRLRVVGNAVVEFVTFRHDERSKG